MCRDEANEHGAVEVPDSEAAARFAQAASALKRKDAQDRAAVQVGHRRCNFAVVQFAVH